METSSFQAHHQSAGIIAYMSGAAHSRGWGGMVFCNPILLYSTGDLGSNILHMSSVADPGCPSRIQQKQKGGNKKVYM